MLQIKDNIIKLKNRIYETCNKIGRDPTKIKIIGVTKTVDVETIKIAIEHGITAIGENKVQEIREKYDKINKSVEWHMIGHLQTNKVKYIIDKVDLIHSLDSLKLAREIEKRSEKANKIMNALVQINIANEKTKFGINADEIYDFIHELSSFNYLKVKGLMAIVPYVENTEEVRPYFKRMKNIFDTLKVKNISNVEMRYLSMGMTNDYLVAIEEGANMIRIGTGIFGVRNYN